ncbi:MAG: Gfo/Idh/MocA family oxidoreductase [Thermoguttaceae bacterium]|jgi:predicted dehydrogenase|nr:Gfo/Idh/MocA family oxidoreductase [Thermoguttaceae bacterium]
MSNHKHQGLLRPSRRQFLETAAAGALAAGLSIQRGAHAAGSGAIKIGLIGCGGRGSGAAVNAMNAGDEIRLVAVADVFEDYAKGARDRLKKLRPNQVDVPDDRVFVGFDAYQKVIQSGVDVVLIAAASHFHPMHLKAAIDAGKHVFCEKPHGVDVPGLKMAIAAGEEAKKKGLALVSGLCWRYDPGVREAMKRVRDGAIGEVLAIQETYITSPYGLRERKPGWSEMEYQLQNWYHFNWLSGDQTGQQLIHSLDKASWALGDKPPAKAWGLGGRQVCVEPKYGDQFDHHAVVFEYDNGVRVFGFCRDQVNCYNETSDVIIGSKGRAILPSRPRIEGPSAWEYKGPKVSMYDVEHKELFDSIRAGKPINNSDYMFTSTMLGILAQMVCYTGQQLTWEQAMASELRLAPSRYAWDAEPPVLPGPNGQYPCALPGVTKFK